MSSAAAGTVVSLDDYRSTRGDRRATPAAAPAPTSVPAPVRLAPVWVYWVPVWVW